MLDTFFSYLNLFLDEFDWVFSFALFFVPLFALYVIYVKQLSNRKPLYFVLWLNIFSAFIIDSFFDSFNKSILIFILILSFLNLFLLVYSLLQKFSTMSGVRGSQGKAVLPLNKWIVYPFEAFLLFLFYVIARIIPLRILSWLAEKAAIFVSKRDIKVNRITIKNIHKCYPEYSEAQCQKLLTDSWIVFLKFLFEIPKISSFWRNYKKFVSIEGMQYLEELKGKPFVVMFAHYGSLSLLMLPFKIIGLKVSLLYRFPNNHLTSWFFNISINFIGGTPIPKGEAGTKLLFKSLRHNIPVMIAVDQKFEGSGSVDSTFFGRVAPSAPGVVKFAEAFNCPVLPMRVFRLKGLNQKIVIDKPFFVKDSVEVEQQRINDMVEKWVREDPKQWLWLHNRWKKDE